MQSLADGIIMEELDKARELARKAKKILVFTGPGISAASGIPCSGISGDITVNADAGNAREVLSPVNYRQFVDSTMHRQLYWKFLLSNYPLYKSAAPNSAHFAIKALQDSGRLFALITQNEDNLHRISGINTDILTEIHGSCLYAECFDCYDWISMDEALENFARSGCPPMCHCGGWLKPAMLMNGEETERENLIKAFQAANECDLVIAAGSSLRREPSSSVPLAAMAGGKPYVIINPDVTAHDKAADIKLCGDASEILPEILR